MNNAKGDKAMKQANITKRTSINERVERVTTEYRLPAHWAGYLVNGDPTGYDDDELERIEQWEHDHPDEYCVAIDDEVDFCVEGDDDELACERCIYLFEKLEDYSYEG